MGTKCYIYLTCIISNRCLKIYYTVCKTSVYQYLTYLLTVHKRQAVVCNHQCVGDCDDASCIYLGSIGASPDGYPLPSRRGIYYSLSIHNHQSCRIELSNPSCLFTDTVRQRGLDNSLRHKRGNGYLFLHICFI